MSLDSDALQVELPKKLLPLFQPKRFKVLRGGRGSSKSWSIAQALVVLGYSRPLRILCTREVQKSIKESVKMLLDDRIEGLGLSKFYTSLDTEIRGANGTLFAFAGLAQHTVDSIKSYEGFDIVWVEEAHSVSAKSWNTLIPTIRKDGSEIWVSFNPELDTDPVWKRFVENPPPDCWSIECNWSDNPWFPKVLEAERLHCKVTQPEDYDTIWEGKCRAAVVGAIYAKEIQQAISDQRITFVPYNPNCLVHTIWDLGWNDSMTIIMVQKIGPSALAVIDYLEDSQRTLDSYAKELNDKPYNWGDDWIPHDGRAKDFKTGQSTQQLLKKLRGGREPRITPDIGVESGIKAARMVFPRVFFDKGKTEKLVNALRRYRRSVPTTTGEPGAPVHDENSHGADAFRYLSVVAEELTNERAVGPVAQAGIIQADTSAGY